MWFYVDSILVRNQVADAATQQRPRGNLSDLYPRWVGTRELLLHHRNPYGQDIDMEIQRGYYGRALDPSRPNDPIDQQGFAYPVYVAFLLAPLIKFPFHGVQIFFHWLLISATAASVWLWLRALRWRPPSFIVCVGVVLALGSFPAVQGIKLQQLSLLVALFLAGSAACVIAGRFFSGGVLLAMATIKPQLAWLLVAWMLVWCVSNWSSRRRFALGFGLAMFLLLGCSEIILPGWYWNFLQALVRYHRYTRNQSVLLLPWSVSGIFAAAFALASALLLWKVRRVPVEGEIFVRTVALVLALTVLVVPMFAPYNQVLLLPAILALAKDRKILNSSSRGVRLMFAAGALALAWQWAASIALSVAYLLGFREWALRAWKVPFFLTLAFPVLVFALSLLDLRLTRQTDFRRENLI